MIEKISPYDDGKHIVGQFNNYEMGEKINELVDAVNILQEHAHPTARTVSKMENVAENLTAGGRIRIDGLDDPFAENVQPEPVKVYVCPDGSVYDNESVAKSHAAGELDRTRKALEVAKDAIDVISLKYHKDTPSIFLIKYAQNAKEQITALEQKDVK